ncbi:uncharacterized protein METZ01_LOCUS383325, partial [marine metagenome]
KTGVTMLTQITNLRILNIVFPLIFSPN